MGLGALAILIPDITFDTTAWMHESLNFCKFVIGTGTALVLLPATDFLELFKKKKFFQDDDEEE